MNNVSRNKLINTDNFKTFKALIKILLIFEREEERFDKNYLNDFKYLFDKLQCIEIEEIIYFIKRHRLELFFYKNKLVDIIMPSLNEKLYKIAIKSTIDALNLKKQTIEITQILNEQNIKYLVLKGISLSYKTLKNKSSRGGGDLDIFVDKSSLYKCIQILESHSFQIYNPSLPKFSNSLLAGYCMWANYEILLFKKSTNGYQWIDLHWELSYVKDSLPNFIDCWREKEEIKIDNYYISTLSTRHDFFHACAHSAKDKWMLIRNILDIDRLARIIDRDNLILETKSRQISMSTLVTFYFSNGKYLLPYHQKNYFYKYYVGKTYFYFMRIEPKLLSANGWTPISRLMNVFHRSILTRNFLDIIKIVVVNFINPESIIDAKTRKMNPILKIVKNRIYSLFDRLSEYFFKN